MNAEIRPHYDLVQKNKNRKTSQGHYRALL